MRYLILVILLLVGTNTFAAGRINPFNGKPITYSLSEKTARDAMGGYAYDKMRMQQWRIAKNNQRGYYGGRARYEFGGGNFGMDLRRAGETVWGGVVGDAENNYDAYNGGYGGRHEWTTGAANSFETGWNEHFIGGADDVWYDQVQGDKWVKPLNNWLSK